ncbi:transglutaminase domain-containing protein [uncultured Methanospirillum sp.]|uniref:transglutaminase-like domain-containing protein n=1 Tax=uncultured Methanospirillum sp. TaxID=262503 RepID=UPI0029C729A6|nr:transglutaminase domain-containing protein [uncultured Methanospirillum sp.]
MKRIFLISLMACMLTVVIIAAGDTSDTQTEPSSQGDTLFAQGEKEFNASNFHSAADMFTLAQEKYSTAGDRAAYIRARDMSFLSTNAGTNFPYNRSEIETEMAQAFPNASAAQRDAWLDAPMTATLKSEGEVWYFSETIHNVRNHNPSILQEENTRAHHTPLYDELIPLITASWNNGNGTYGAPVTYTGSTVLNIPRENLPANGTLKVWMPVPIESGSQTNVTILSMEPSQYVQSSTGVGGDIGLVYLEIPLEEITDPFLNITARYSFVQHEQRFSIDPAKVLPYNTSSPEYLQYTASSKNVALTPEIKATALSIVGNETNPYFQAQKLYWDTITTHPYSHAPHFWLDVTGIPESQYVLETGIGDCASQSLYFAALCRSLGIPARATGGYQMIEGSAGTHIWAEYYLEGYGWIPVDVTAAEGGDASYNATPDDLHRYKAYYFGSLDPYRFIIQKNLDLPVIPDAGDAVIPPSGWVQLPKIACDTCTDNPMTLSFMFSKVTVTKE